IFGIASTYGSSASLATLLRFGSLASIGTTCSDLWTDLSADRDLSALEVLDRVLPLADSLDFKDFIDNSASFLVLFFFFPTSGEIPSPLYETANFPVGSSRTSGVIPSPLLESLD
nr:hypothetical protein [Tanacetum cinerariifolium]